MSTNQTSERTPTDVTSSIIWPIIAAIFNGAMTVRFSNWFLRAYSAGDRTFWEQSLIAIGAALFALVTISMTIEAIQIYRRKQKMPSE